VFNEFSNQLRENSRLRLGVMFALGILWLYLLLILRDTLQEANQQYDSITQSIARQQDQLAQPEWVARSSDAKRLSEEMEGRLWQAATSGIAQAAFQDELNAAMQRAGVSKSQITATVIDEIVEGAPINAVSNTDTPPDLWKIKAIVGFEYNAKTLLAFLGEIEGNDKHIVEVALNVRREPQSRVEFELVGYFKKQTSPVVKELVPL